MATRTISTKLEIEGESSYKQSITNVNSTLKNLRSELSLVQAQYQNQQNSVTALSAKEQALNAIHDAQSAKLSTLKSYLQSAQEAQSRYASQVEQAKSKLDDMNSALASLDPAVKAAGESWAKYAQEAEKTEAELKALQSSTGDTSAQQEELSRKLADAKAKMAELETSTDGAAKEAGEMVLQQQKLSDQLAQSEDVYDRSTRAVNNLQSQVNGTQKALYDTDAELQRTRTYLDEAKTSSDGCATSIDEFGNKAKQSGENAEGAFSTLKDALVALGLVKAIKEIADALSECVEAADDFEYQMAYVETLADTSSSAWGTMEDDIIDLSNAYGIAATELSSAAYQALSAGVATENAAEFLETASQLSVAGMTTTTAAVDLLTNAINVYGLEASDAAAISDELLQVQNLGKTTINDLASVYSVSATQAAAFGVSIENLNASFAVLTKNGVSTANAGTYLSSMFTELADEGSTVATILKEKTGKSFEELNEAGYSLGDIMQILYDSVDGNSTAFSNLWSNVRAGRAALNIAQTGTEEYNTVLGKISDSAGLTAESYEILADTGTTAANRVSEATTNLQIAMGDALSPAVEKVNNLFADLLSGAANIISECPALAAGLTAVAVALVSMTAGSAVLANLPTIISAIRTAWTAMSAAITGSAAGVVLVFASLAAAAATFLLTLDGEETELEQFSAAVDDLVDSIEEARAAFADTGDEIERSAVENRALADSLEELLGVEDKSASQKARIASIIDSLNDGIEGLSLAYDEETDSINMSTDAINDCIDAQEKQASNAAAIERLAEIDEERANIAAELASIEDEVAAAQGRVNQTLEETGTINPYNSALVELGDYYDKVVGLQEQDAALAAETEELSASVDQYAQTQAAAADATDAAAAAAEDTATTLEELATAYEEAYDSALESLEGQFDLWEEVGDITERSATSIKDALQTQIEYWTDYADNMEDALNRGIDGLDEFVASIDDGSTDAAGILAGLKDSTDDEIREMLAAWNDLQDVHAETASSQADLATGYSETLEEMEEDTESSVGSMLGIFATFSTSAPNLVRGVPASISDALAGSSAQSLYSSAGNTASTAFSDAVKAGRSTATSAGSSLGSSALSGVSSAASYAAFSSVGTNAADGLISGVAKAQAKAYAAGYSIGESTLHGTKTALAVKSPSRKMMEVGDYTMQGFEQGIEERLPQTTQTVKASAEASYNAFASGLNGAAQAVSDVSSGATGGLSGSGALLSRVESLISLFERYAQQGQAINLNCTVKTNDEAIGKAAVRYFRRDNKTTGGEALASCL